MAIADCRNAQPGRLITEVNSYFVYSSNLLILPHIMSYNKLRYGLFEQSWEVGTGVTNKLRPMKKLGRS